MARDSQSGLAPVVPASLAASTAEFTGRGWVLDSVNSWLAGGERRFLLVGDAGTGKSTIAARLVEISRGMVGSEHPRLAEGFVSAAHFCRAREDQTLDPTRVLEHLSSQLAARYRPFREALQREAERPGVTLAIEGTATAQTAADYSEVIGVRVSLDVAGVSAREAFDRCLRRPLDALCAERSEPVVILIDALDEALGYEVRSGLVELLRAATGYRW